MKDKPNYPYEDEYPNNIQTQNELASNKACELEAKHKQELETDKKIETLEKSNEQPKLKEFEVTFIAHHVISVEAQDEDEAEQKAIDLFDGQVDFEREVEEVEE